MCIGVLSAEGEAVPDLSFVYPRRTSFAPCAPRGRALGALRQAVPCDKRCPAISLYLSFVREMALMLILPAAAAALRLPVTALPGPALCRPHRHALTMPSMTETGSGGTGPAALVGFVSDRAAGLAVAGGLGFVAEKVASRMPISLSPLLYATAFGIAIGNTLRLIDPELKAMAPTTVGMSFAKRRLLRAGIILYGAKVTRSLDP